MKMHIRPPLILLSLCLPLVQSAVLRHPRRGPEKLLPRYLHLDDILNSTIPLPNNTIVPPNITLPTPPTPLPNSTLTPLHHSPTTSAKIRGVNLGGWLLLEPWITPHLFDAISLPSVKDEYTYCEWYGPERCQVVIDQHWDNFITEEDFQLIKSYGLDSVRIPIGYWAVNPVEGEPYVQGQLPYLDRAMVWARKWGLKVWIDLHGAKGGQNGFDNQGRFGAKRWQDEQGNIDHTIQTLRLLAYRYATGEYEGVLTAIELLNEPFGKAAFSSLEFSVRAYHAVRAISPTLTIVISDANQSPEFWSHTLLPSHGAHNLYLDAHKYQVFTSNLPIWEGHSLDLACKQGHQVKALSVASQKPVVVAEWSAVWTDCARYLNSYQSGSRYEGTFGGATYMTGWCGPLASGSISRLQDEEMERTRRLVEAQIESWELVDGWFFWTWKTSRGAPGWDMKDLFENGLFPTSTEDRRYPNICAGRGTW